MDSTLSGYDKDYRPRRPAFIKRTLILPFEMRAELKIPLGQLLIGEPSCTILQLNRIINKKKPPMFAVVGDFTTKNILEANIKPNIVVLDHRVMRVEVEPLAHKTRHVFKCVNKQGTIDLEAWKALEKAITLKCNTAVIVEGEEDLLVLPLILMMPLRSLIIYGQPREGMVVVEATEERKVWAEDFLARMEENNTED
jgi:uncharacterized protein (UPF0218 family)